MNVAAGIFGIGLIVTYVAVILAFIAGWINNLVWLMSDTTQIIASGEVIVAVLGIVVAPVGAIHGLWVW